MTTAETNVLSCSSEKKVDRERRMLREREEAVAGMGSGGLPPRHPSPPPPPPPPSSSGSQLQVEMDDFIVKISHLLSLHTHSASHFRRLCFTLARAIDAAIRRNMTPSDPHQLFRVLKKVWQLHKEANGISAIMVLMISVKNACRHQWFQAEDSNYLLAMSDEISSSFNIADNIVLEAGDTIQVTSELIHRYYPKLASNYVISSFEVKSGYNILVSTFDFTKDIDALQSVRLFVAQKDNVETSACLVNPAEVTFLINGKYVEGRTNALDNGPQLPTDITRMVKKGVNLFQAIGSFSGSYVIAIAVMSPINISGVPGLQDYVQPVTPADKSDSEVIEGASRISLNCPISFQRVKLPVKGHLCKHYQCFDYDNFININSRKPTWRCPLCNQPVSYIDIRIDQEMVKILREVGESISDVIILNDGSWKMVEQHDNAAPLQKSTNENHNDDHEASQNGGKESGGCAVPERNDFASNTPVVDLTMEDHEPYIQDGKPCQTVGQDNWLSDYLVPQTTLSNTQNTSRVYTEMSSQICLPHSALDGSTPWVTAAQSFADFVPILGNSQDHFFGNPVLPTTNQAGSDVLGMQHSTSSMRNAPSTSPSLDNLQSQRMNFRNHMDQPVLPGVGSMVATPSLLANMPGTTYNQRPQINGSTFVMPCSSWSPSRLQSYPQLTNYDGNIFMNGGLMGSLQVPRTSNVASALRQLPQGTQMQQPLPRQVHQYSNYPLQNPPNAAMTQEPLRPLLHLNSQNLYLQRQHVQAPQTMIQTSLTTLPSQLYSMPQTASIGMANLGLMNLQAQTNVQHASGLSRSSRGPVYQMPMDDTRLSAGSMVWDFSHHPATRPDGLPGSTDWQGTGRMRGCLTGNAYFEALSRYTSQQKERLHANES